MSIRLLHDHLINKIAAGEVIERPASVVKELLENAIDAGASRIAVRITGGGGLSIEVEDDGEGIPLNEISLAFQRHATSKLSSVDDLQQIITMGFRGEALPSIAAVARVKVFSRCAGEPGLFFHIEGGRILACEEREAVPGTRMLVEDLFYNTPARKHFQKSPVSEGIFINELVGRYALARPDISISFSNEGRLYYKTPGNGQLRDAIIAVHGSSLMEQLLPLSYEGENISLSGYISRPELKKSNRKLQCFYINCRPIRSPLLYRAVDQAYQGMLVSREFPVAIINIVIDPGQVDINVHPQKNEVRFRKDHDVFRAVHEVIKNRLQEHQVGISGYQRVAHEAAAGTDLAEAISGGWISGGIPAFQNYKPAFQPKPRTLEPDPVIRYQDPATAAVNIIGQFRQSYILAEIDRVLYIVDQHAAHERIIFNRLLDRDQAQARECQELVFPVVIELSTLKVELLQEQSEFFRSLGFDLGLLGHNTAVIRAVPAGLSGHEEQTIVEMLDAPQPEGKDQWRVKALMRMACQQAVKAGQLLNQAEMAQLIMELLDTPDYKYCPHGRPTLIKISSEDLEHMFKR